MNKDRVWEIILHLVFFTCLCAFMNDVVIFHRLDLVYGLIMAQYSWMIAIIYVIIEHIHKLEEGIMTCISASLSLTTAEA